MANINPEDLINLAKQASILSDVSEILGKQEETIKKMSDLQRANLQSSIESLERKKEEYEFSQLFYNDLSNSYKIDQKRQELKKQELLAQMSLLNARKQNNDISEEEYKREAKNLILLERGLNAYDAAKSKLEQISGLLGVERAEDNLLYIMLRDPAKAFAGAVEGMKKLTNPLNLVMSSLLKMVELSMAQADSFAQIQKETGIVFGGMSDMEKSMMNSSNATRRAGVSIKENNAATLALINNFNEFTDVSSETQQKLIETTSVLEKFGISAQFSAQNVSILTKAFNDSSEDAMIFNTRFTKLATSLKMPIDQLTKGFGEASNNLLAMSGNSNEMFENFSRLATVSKSVGMEISRIISITDKFDTFDSAAQSVGKLNALLGGPYLNTLEMVSATDPTERFTKLKEAVDMAGLSFDTMSYYEKKALQQSLGLESMAELAAFMAGNMDSIATPESTMTQAELAELQNTTMQFRTVMEEIQTIAMRMAVGFGPVVTVIKELLFYIGSLYEYVVPLAQGFAILVASIHTLNFMLFILDKIVYANSIGFANYAREIYMSAVAMYQNLGPAIASAIPGLSSLNAALAANKIAFIGTLLFFAVAVGAALYYLGANIGWVAVGLVGLTAGIYAMSAAEKTSVILLGLFLVAAGIAAIAHALAVGNSPSLIEAFIMSAVAIGIFAVASNFMLPLLIAIVPVIAALAFSAVMLGAGFALAGFGFLMAGQGAVLLAQGLASIAQTVTEGGFTLAARILAIASSMTALGASALLSAMPLGLASIAMMGFGAAAYFAMIPIVAISDAVTMIVQSMSTLIELISVNLATAFAGIGEGLTVIVEQMKNLPIPETLAFTAMIVAATPLAAVLGPALITTGALTSALSPGGNTEATTEAADSTATGESPAEITFNLNLSIDGGEFAKVVNKVNVDPTKDRALYNSIRKMITSGQESV